MCKHSKWNSCFIYGSIFKIIIPLYCHYCVDLNDGVGFLYSLCFRLKFCCLSWLKNSITMRYLCIRYDTFDFWGNKTEILYRSPTSCYLEHKTTLWITSVTALLRGQYAEISRTTTLYIRYDTSDFGVEGCNKNRHVDRTVYSVSNDVD